MKIAYITTGSTRNIHDWSGLNYHIAKALEKQGAEIEYIDNLSAKESFFDFIRRLFTRIVFHKYAPTDRTFSVAKQYAREIEKRLPADTDIVFSPGSLPVALLKTAKKKVFYTDATFAAMLNYYAGFDNLATYAIRTGNKLEKCALQNCDLIFYASDWAAKSAINDYSTDPKKVKVVPFGANMECSRTEADIKQIIKNKLNGQCNLLFCGVDWNRKGGEIAVQIAREIRNKNIPVHLDIVGPREHLELPDFAENHGFISKETTEGCEKLNELFTNAHFFLLPTRAECYGLVFCEAASFGLPGIATKTGGIPTIIKDNVTGMTFDLPASSMDYANYIMHLLGNPDEYENLSLSAFRDYKERLNWDVAGKTIINQLTIDNS
ncbi:MAG: glycosyltransferase family 4 protein [Dysgonamonadaceae bacterium]|jgi:glycosyltransferase involved in cell wall biosynthesis|nr:glycosyltransferase family 4 protein [Dysgonamonadaceae bacterium]